MARAALTALPAAAPEARLALACVTALFFGWGFICANNDPLIAAVQRVFGLSYTAALCTQIASFGAFAIVSLPAAALLARWGTMRTIWVALAVMIAGCLVIQLCRWVPDFAVVLAAIFVVASGVTALQVAANPLAAALGPPERSHYRLTLAHSFNSLGMVCGVHFGARFVLAGEAFRPGKASSGAEGVTAITQAYLVLAGLLVLLAVLTVLARRTIAAAAVPEAPSAGGALAALRSRWARYGALGIALYVGAEVSIGSTLILFLSQPGTLALPMAEAGALVANLYWGGALVGRFLGSWALRFVPAPRLLMLAGAAATLLCAAALALPGPAAGWCLLAVGLCNSIMFPTIFGLTLDRSGVPASATSGLLVLAIGGGAVLPLLTGRIADMAGLGLAFGVPMIAYLYIAGFALACMRRVSPDRPR